VTEDRIVRLPDDEVDGLQEWVRETDDDDLRGVGALQMGPAKDRWSWQVFVNVAEFLREEPLEGELRAVVDQAIRSVPGVTEVAEEDREVWILSGDPSGEALVRSVGEAVDQLAPRARAHLDQL
jgi:hypothetical protein